MKKYTLCLIIASMYFIFPLCAQENTGKTLPEESVLMAKIDGRPLFIENKGQWDDEILYAMKLRGMNIIVSESGIIYDLYKDKDISGNGGNGVRREGHTLAMTIIDGGADIKVRGKSESAGVWNYFIGNDKSKWAKNARVYKSVILEGFYDGVDVALLLDKGFPRYDFILKPGADPSKIKFKFEGTDGVKLDDKKGIVIRSRFGDLFNGSLFAYQTINGKQKEVECNFKIDDGTVGFDIGGYDSGRELIIDPIIYSSYFGGGSDDAITGIAYDKDGAFVVAGWTESFDFHTTPGVYDETYSSAKDAFVAKFRIVGTDVEMIFSTIIGDDDYDACIGVGVDNESSIYISGTTASREFPMQSPIYPYFNELKEVFAAKFDSSGSELLYSSIFGGIKDDIANAMKVDADGDVYIVGQTNSRDFPKKTSYEPEFKGLNEVFALKINKSGSTLEYSTLIGGSGEDMGLALDVDYAGVAYITGETNSGDFPAVPYRDRWWGGQLRIYEQPYDYTYNGGSDAFLLKLSAPGGSLEYSSYFGGLNDDRGTGVLVDTDGTCFFAGDTRKEIQDRQFPVSEFAYSSKHNGSIDCFFAKMDNVRTWTQSGRTRKAQDLIFSSFLGGSGDEYITGMIRNPISSVALLTGYTRSSKFPVVDDDEKYHGGWDAFIVKFNTGGSDLEGSRLFGGGGDDKCFAADYDARGDLGDLYFAGSTSSNNLETFEFTLQDEFGGGGSDGFYAKIVDAELYLNEPSSGDKFCAGTPSYIRWGAAGFQLDDVFKVELRRLSDSLWKVIAPEVEVNLYRWDIPIDMPAGDDYVIRISNISGIYDVSKEPFSIMSPPSLSGIRVEPEDMTVCEYKEVRFFADAEGAELKFTWFFDGTEIEGENNQELIMTDISWLKSGRYKVIVSGRCVPPVESDEYELTVIPETKVTMQPEDLSVIEGDSASFSITAIGGNLEYQWFKDGEALFQETGPVLVINPVSRIDSGMYFCVLNGDCEADSSDEARLTVDSIVSVFGGRSEHCNGRIRIEDLRQSVDAKTIQAVIISEPGRAARLSIIDNLGKTVLRLKGKMTSTGRTELSFDAGTLTAGVYWLLAEYGKERAVMKFQYIR